MILQHIVNALALGSLYALFAIGVALIFGVMKLVNFAYGELILIGAIAAYFTSGMPWPLRIAIILGSSILLAVLQERIAFRPLRGASPATLLVASFAVSIILQNIARFVIGSQPLGVEVLPIFNEQLTIAGARIPMVSVVTVIVGAVLLGGPTLFLQRSPLGIQMRAAAENFSLARLCGVKANRVIMVAFALSGLLAGSASILLVGQTATLTVEMGLVPVLFGFIAATIGGNGSLIGAAIGGMGLGIASTVLQIFLPLELSGFRDAILFLVVLLFMAVRPGGLIRPRGGQRV